jgi:glycopeptide antibiotics resistance protein
MYVKSLKLQQILLKPEFAKIRQWLLITWIIFGLLAVVVLVVGYIKNKQQALAGFLISLIWIGILLPARIKYKIAHNAFIGHGSAGHHYMMARPESQMFSFVLSPPEWDIFKLGHFILFGILACLLSSRNTYHLKPLHNLGLLAILALLTEIGQLFIPGRTPTLTDIFIDLSGAGVGLMIKACLINFSNRSTGQNA